MGRGVQDGQERGTDLLFDRRFLQSLPEREAPEDGTRKAKPVDLRAFVGAFAEGYDEYDASRVLTEVSRRLDARIICVWERLDFDGYAGDSYFVVLDGDKVRNTPEELDELLLLGSKSPDPVIDAAKINSGEVIPDLRPEQLEESSANPHNAVIRK